MAKKAKLETPDWIREGFDSKADWEKSHGVKKQKKEGKIFKIRLCPKCSSDKVNVILSGNDSADTEEEDQILEGKGTGEWECRKCKWHGEKIKEKEFSEEEFMKYLDEKGEEVA